MTDPAPQPALQIFTSRQFTSWLGEAAASLVLTTYQSGKVLFIGCNPETGKLSIFERTIERPNIYRLVVGWATLEDHMVHFRESSDFQEWRRLVGPHFAAPPKVEHTHSLGLT